MATGRVTFQSLDETYGLNDPQTGFFSGSAKTWDGDIVSTSEYWADQSKAAATAAGKSETACVNIAKSIQQTYFGGFAEAPVADPITGAPLDPGDIYYNTVDGFMYVWSSGGAWVPLSDVNTVTSIIEGNNISISPPYGTGDVTISATGDVASIIGGTGISLPDGGTGVVTIDNDGVLLSPGSAQTGSIDIDGSGSFVAGVVVANGSTSLGRNASNGGVPLEVHQNHSSGDIAVFHNVNTAGLTIDNTGSVESLGSGSFVGSLTVDGKEVVQLSPSGTQPGSISVQGVIHSDSINTNGISCGAITSTGNVKGLSFQVTNGRIDGTYTGANSALVLNQTGSGPIADFNQGGANKASIRADGSFTSLGAGSFATGSFQTSLKINSKEVVQLNPASRQMGELNVDGRIYCESSAHETVGGSAITTQDAASSSDLADGGPNNISYVGSQRYHEDQLATVGDVDGIQVQHANKVVVEALNQLEFQISVLSGNPKFRGTLLYDAAVPTNPTPPYESANYYIFSSDGQRTDAMGPTPGTINPNTGEFYSSGHIGKGSWLINAPNASQNVNGYDEFWVHLEFDFSSVIAANVYFEPYKNMVLTDDDVQIAIEWMYDNSVLLDVANDGRLELANASAYPTFKCANLVGDLVNFYNSSREIFSIDNEGDVKTFGGFIDTGGGYLDTGTGTISSGAITASSLDTGTGTITSGSIDCGSIVSSGSGSYVGRVTADDGFQSDDSGSSLQRTEPTYPPLDLRQNDITNNGPILTMRNAGGTKCTVLNDGSIDSQGSGSFATGLTVDGSGSFFGLTNNGTLTNNGKITTGTSGANSITSGGGFITTSSSSLGAISSSGNITATNGFITTSSSNLGSINSSGSGTFTSLDTGTGSIDCGSITSTSTGFFATNISAGNATDAVLGANLSNNSTSATLFTNQWGSGPLAKFRVANGADRLTIANDGSITTSGGITVAETSHVAAIVCGNITLDTTGNYGISVNNDDTNNDIARFRSGDILKCTIANDGSITSSGSGTFTSLETNGGSLDCGSITSSGNMLFDAGVTQNITMYDGYINPINQSGELAPIIPQQLNPGFDIAEFRNNVGAVANVLWDGSVLSSGDITNAVGTVLVTKEWVLSNTGTGDGTGTVTDVATGVGLTGGPIVDSGTISVVFGTEANQVCMGNDDRLGLASSALQPGEAATVSQGLEADSALQPGEAATPHQGDLADSALQIVTTDNITLTGDGTVADPLSVVPVASTPLFAVVNIDPIYPSNRYVTDLSQVAPFYSNDVPVTVSIQAWYGSSPTDRSNDFWGQVGWATGTGLNESSGAIASWVPGQGVVVQTGNLSIISPSDLQGNPFGTSTTINATAARLLIWSTGGAISSPPP